MPNYKELGAKLREMAHSYKYEEDPDLDDFNYVFDISQAELELLDPVDPGAYPRSLLRFHPLTPSLFSTFIRPGWR